MKDEPMIVERIHGIGAVRENLSDGFLLEKFASQAKIFFCIFQFREENSNQPEAECFTNCVIAMRGNGIVNIFMDPFGMRGDHDDELCYPFRSGGWRLQEGVESERPRQET